MILPPSKFSNESNYLRYKNHLVLSQRSQGILTFSVLLHIDPIHTKFFLIMVQHISLILLIHKYMNY